jgi:hypothetical protein
MRRFFVIFSLLTCVFLIGSADDVVVAINLQHQGYGHDNHFNYPIPAEQPDVYYNNVSQTIIIDGMGEVEYYDVEIMSLSSFDVLISTQVNGYYDTIDISSLPDGEYVITIDAPTGNSFEGFFSTY